MLYLALGLIILGYLGTVLIAWQSTAKRDYITYSALLFVSLGAFGAMWVTIDSGKTTDKLMVKSNKISELSLKLYSSSSLISDSQRELRKRADNQAHSQLLLREKSDEIARLYREIAVTQRKLSEKSEEISNINKIIAASITGGDYHGEFTIDRPRENNVVGLYFANLGKHPLYDVHMNIEDFKKVGDLMKPFLDKLRKNTPVGMLEFEENKMNGTSVINLGNIGPQQGTYASFVIPNLESMRYRIQAIARNGVVTKIVTYKKVKGSWKMSVTEYISGKTPKVTTDADFPMNAKGEIEL